MRGLGLFTAGFPAFFGLFLCLIGFSPLLFRGWVGGLSNIRGLGEDPYKGEADFAPWDICLLHLDFNGISKREGVSATAEGAIALIIDPDASRELGDGD